MLNGSIKNKVVPIKGLCPPTHFDMQTWRTVSGKFIPAVEETLLRQEFHSQLIYELALQI